MPRPPTPLHRTVGSLLAVTGILLAGCSAERPELASEEEPTSTSVSTTTTTDPRPPSRVAQAKDGSVAVYEDATADAPSLRVTAQNATAAPGTPLVFLVRSERDGRYEVWLPGPPSGSTGWIDEAEVSIATIDHRIEVRLGEHRIRVLEDDEVVVDEPIGVGRTDRPAPGGAYYLKELLQPEDPTGPYGTYAYGLSGFSTVLSSFNGGEGLVGIHGTDDPEALGQDVPTGCIHVHNDVIDRLVNEVGLPLGTPVAILP